MIPLGEGTIEEYKRGEGGTVDSGGITNSISSHRKLSNNEIQQPNKYKMVFERV